MNCWELKNAHWKIETFVEHILTEEKIAGEPQVLCAEASNKRTQKQRLQYVENVASTIAFTVKKYEHNRSL